MSLALCGFWLMMRLTLRGFSNGKTSGIMLPSAHAQQQVIVKAYQRAGLPTDETDYVEVGRDQQIEVGFCSM